MLLIDAGRALVPEVKQAVQHHRHRSGRHMGGAMSRRDQPDAVTGQNADHGVIAVDDAGVENQGFAGVVADLPAHGAAGRRPATSAGRSWS